MVVTGLHVTSYASGDTPLVSIEAQKSNPYMSEIDKELKDFFAEYKERQLSSDWQEELLDTAVNEVQSKIDSHAHFLNVMSDSAQKEDMENKFAALKLKHSILSTVKTNAEKRASLQAKLNFIEKIRERHVREWKNQHKKEQKNKLEKN